MSAYQHATDPGQLLRRLNGGLTQQHNAHVRNTDRPIGASEHGAEVFQDVFAYLGRFVAYPSLHAQVAHTLWIVHTHLMDAWESTPRLAALSPEPASGKTRLLELTETLVPNPVEAVNVTPAYLFRKVESEDGRPTILYDEIDTVFGPKAKDNEEIRGLLNAGHRRGAVAGRCVVRGKVIETEEIPAYCAVALAGLGDLPDTILSRAVVVRMRRRGAGERVEPYRRRVHAAEGHALRNRLGAWAATVAERVAGAWPEMPAGVEDRNADMWEPLLAVADAAGGVWPELTRDAAVALVADARDTTPSLGIRLLADVRAVFDDADTMSTDALLKALHDLPESPWSDLVAGKPLNPRGLATRLGKYGVKPKTVRIGEHTPRGYTREDLADAWARYLPALPEKSATRATAATDTDAPASESPLFRANGHRNHLTEPLHVSGRETPQRSTSATDSSQKTGDVAGVADVADSGGSRGERVCVECGQATADSDGLYCPAHGALGTPSRRTQGASSHARRLRGAR